MPSPSVVEAEQRLCVMMQDLVGFAVGESEPLDVGEGLLVGFVILQYRVVAACHQMVGAERLQRASEGGFRAVAYGVVPELLGGDAWRLGKVRMAALALALLVETVEQHRNWAAKVWHDELDVGIAVGDL